MRLTLPLDDFLRRFLLHLLPKGFVRIRNFGFLANRKRATTLPLCFQSLEAAPQQQLEPDTSSIQLSNTCAALYVVPRWRSSKRSRLLRFNFVLHRWPHETTLANSNSLRASACSASLYFAPNKSLSHLLHLRSRQHHLSPPTPLPHRLTGALHYGTVWAHLNTAPSHH